MHGIWGSSMRRVSGSHFSTPTITGNHAKLERQLAFSEGAGLVGSRWFTEAPGKPRSVAKIADAGFFGRTFRPRESEAFHVAMNLWTSVSACAAESAWANNGSFQDWSRPRIAIFGSGWLHRRLSTLYPSHLPLTSNGRNHSPIAIPIGIARACSRSCIATPRCSGRRESANRRR